MRQSIVPLVLRQLPADGWLLFATRSMRLFAYGSLSVVLVFYLIGVGLSQTETGTLLTLTLVGDTAVSLYDLVLYRAFVALRPPEEMPYEQRPSR